MGVSFEGKVEVGRVRRRVDEAEGYREVSANSL